MKNIDLEDAYRKVNDAVRYGIERLAELGEQIQHIAQNGAKSMQKGWDSIEVPDLRKLANLDITPVRKNFEENKSAWIIAGAVAVGLIAGLMIADSARRKTRH